MIVGRNPAHRLAPDFFSRPLPGFQPLIQDDEVMFTILELVRQQAGRRCGDCNLNERRLFGKALQDAGQMPA